MVGERVAGRKGGIGRISVFFATREKPFETPVPQCALRNVTFDVLTVNRLDI